MQGRRRKAGPSSRRRAVSSTQGRQLSAGPSAQCRAVSSVQGRQLGAGRPARCSAVSSVQGGQLSAGPSAQCRAVSSVQGRQLGAGPSARCREVSSAIMQRRQLDAGPSGPVNSTQGPSVSMQARLFQCRAVSSVQGGLSAQHRSCSKQGVISMQCRAVCSMQGPSAQRGTRLLNATPFCSTQGRQLDAKRSRGRQLKARPSAQCKAVRFNAGPCVSMQGSLNARPSLQCRVISSTQGRHLIAWAFGWLDHDLLRELSSEKKPSPWCRAVCSMQGPSVPFFRRSLF